ncbi:glycosyltransferase [Ornithinimicrobium ciconiae]|uniref:D-inositol 3-phosphate glycosyltransferase n=1 Tax=Ornithinimicrobium ciconiae TaxID=2594265 RepID=A0A516GF91_9MICO|nr:glycosyltransferase [Ornithinimicrobium ciconiae]
MFHSAVVDAWRARERELRELGHDVHLLTAQRWDEGGSDVHLEPRSGEQVEGLRTFGRHPALFLYDPRPIWRAMGQDWDVIDIHEEPFALSTAEILAIRKLRRNSAPYVLYSAQNLEKRYPVPFRWLEGWSLRHAAGVQVCNDEAGRILQRKGFPGQPRTIPLGVDLAHFTVSDRPPVSDAPVRVGYVGRLAPHKGVAVLLASLAKLPQLHLTIAGSGPQEEELRQLSRELGIETRMTWLGGVSQEDLPAVYASFDVLAVPSLTTPGWVEQFGRVVIEAMASGVPVVASVSGALPEVVGETGILVPEGDPTALAEALMRVGCSTDLQAVLRQRGLHRAQECSWPAVAADFDELYRVATHQQSLEATDLAPEVVVVAYGAPDLLSETLTSVAGLTVTVVDNSSRDDVMAVCAVAGVRYLDPGHNGGFGTGVNYALARRLTPESDMLLLNPDARITVDGVRRLHHALRSDPTLGSVGSAQVDIAGAAARVAWPWPTPLRSWIEAAGLGRLNSSKDYVIGSVLMLRSEALAQVGGFDEDFFLYAEETDWARRASLMGWRHRVVDSVTATHVGAGTSSDPLRRDTHFYAGQERYFRKHHGALGWQVTRLAQLSGSLVRGVLLPGPRGTAARTRAKLLRAGPRRREREALARLVA